MYFAMVRSHFSPARARSRRIVSRWILTVRSTERTLAPSRSILSARTAFSIGTVISPSGFSCGSGYVLPQSPQRNRRRPLRCFPKLAHLVSQSGQFMVLLALASVFIILVYTKRFVFTSVEFVFFTWARIMVRATGLEPARTCQDAAVLKTAVSAFPPR